jgi:hypothetical protein
MVACITPVDGESYLKIGTINSVILSSGFLSPFSLNSFSASF